MASNGWFLELLDRERATLDEDAYPLPKHQMDAFELCCDVLTEEETSLAKRSKQRRSSRSRAYTLLGDVFLGAGPEVFLLCTLCTSISKLATVSLKGLIPELRRWWKTVPHPAGLTETARELCEANSINSLVAPDRKRQRLEATVNAGMLSCFVSNGPCLLNHNRARFIAKQARPSVGARLIGTHSRASRYRSKGSTCPYAYHRSASECVWLVYPQ